MNPANYYYGYNAPGYGYAPHNYVYPQQYPFYGYHQSPYPNSVPSPMIPPVPQMPPNQPLTFTRPSMANLNMIPPHPRGKTYRNVQNDFSRGFEFDYEFLPNELTTFNSQSKPERENSSYQNNSRAYDSPHKRLSDNRRKVSETNNTNRSDMRIRSRSFRTPKIIKSCQRKMNKAGILFTAIIYSVCDCLFAPESNSLSDLAVKLLNALDGSRLDLSKLMLPHDRLLTEESIDDLEFEILEKRAHRLEKEENSIFSIPVKKISW